MHIAVCLAHKETACHLTQLFKLYEEQRNIGLSCCYFKNDIDLLGSFIPGDYDVLFFSGAAKSSITDEIEKKDNRIQMVCVIPVGIGASAAVREKGHIHYLPEPIEQPFLFSLLDHLTAEIYKNDEMGLVIKNRGCIMHLLFSQIECVEVIGRNLSFHLTDGRTQEVYGTFSYYASQLLQWPDFFKVHRSFLVNLRHIEKLTADGIITKGGFMVPVSRNLYSKLKQVYISGLYAHPAPLPPRSKESAASEECMQTPYTVLLVDDEETERIRWSKVLTDKGCIVHTADSGPAALSLAPQECFDCVVLDVRLGNNSGFDLCETLSEITGAPVVYLSVLTDSEQQMKGFLSGGIDYITKDTSSELFWTKVKTRIKIARTVTSQLSSGDLHLDLKMRKAFFQEQELPLTTVEFDLLYLLMQNPGTIYEPGRLYELIWGGRNPDDGHTASLHLAQLCRKLDNVSPNHTFVEIMWGAGYRFMPQAT